MYSVKNYFEICNEKDYNYIYNVKKEKKILHPRFTNSFEVIKYMYENKKFYLEQIPYTDLLDSQYYNEADEITTLEYSETSIRLNKFELEEEESENEKEDEDEEQEKEEKEEEKKRYIKRNNNIKIKLIL